MEWTKCSDKLPEDGTHCWLCDKDKEIYSVFFRKEQKRHNWSPLGYTTTIEPMFETDEYNESFVFLDDALYWMPYFAPPIPEDFEHNDPWKGWIKCCDRFPEPKQQCEFVVQRCKFKGIHGLNGNFAGIYTSPEGKSSSTMVYSDAWAWKPIGEM